jgi:hypothetical protein
MSTGLVIAGPGGLFRGRCVACWCTIERLVVQHDIGSLGNTTSTFGQIVQF